METKKINTKEAIHLAVLTNVPTLLELEARKMLKALPVWIPKPKRVYKPRKKTIPKLRRLREFECPPAGFLYIYGKNGNVEVSCRQDHVQIERHHQHDMFNDNGMCMPSRGRNTTGHYLEYIAFPPRLPETYIHLHGVELNSNLLGEDDLKMKMVTTGGNILIEANIVVTEMEASPTATRLVCRPIGIVSITDMYVK